MATETGTDRATESEGAILIELDVGRLERRDRPSSPWTALVIGLFTALTCLGLGASVVQPRPIQSTSGSSDERLGQPGTSGPTSPSGPTAGSERRQPPPATPVEAMIRVGTVGDGGRIVRVAGQAAVTVRSLDVTLIVAGRSVAGATVAVPSEATLIVAMSPSGVGAAPWSADLAMPASGTDRIGDAVATVEVAWPWSPAGPAGTLVLVVSLGDGRGR